MAVGSTDGCFLLIDACQPTGSSCQLMLDILEQRGCDLHQELPIWRTEFHAVVVSGLNSKEREIGNKLKRAHVATRFLQPIHQGDKVMSEGSLPALGVDPAFQGLFTGLLQPEPDTAIAETGESQHALRLFKISLGDPQLAQGVRISH
jgi:hypothetical protein